MIVGFTGFRRSGKDTAAAALMANGFIRVSFAGPLKSMLAELLLIQGVSSEKVTAMIDGDLKEVSSQFLNGRSPRHAMQTLGTEWGRDLIAPDLWVSAAMRTAAGYPNVVFTDVRFPNEVDAIHTHGGVVIRVARPSLSSLDDHQSEVLIDSLNVDSVVVNDSSIAGLHMRVSEAIREIQT